MHKVRDGEVLVGQGERLDELCIGNTDVLVTKLATHT